MRLLFLVEQSHCETVIGPKRRKKRSKRHLVSKNVAIDSNPLSVPSNYPILIDIICSNFPPWRVTQLSFDDQRTMRLMSA